MHALWLATSALLLSSTCGAETTRMLRNVFQSGPTSSREVPEYPPLVLQEHGVHFELFNESYSAIPLLLAKKHKFKDVNEVTARYSLTHRKQILMDGPIAVTACNRKLGCQVVRSWLLPKVPGEPRESPPQVVSLGSSSKPSYLTTLDVDTIHGAKVDLSQARSRALALLEQKEYIKRKLAIYDREVRLVRIRRSHIPLAYLGNEYEYQFRAQMEGRDYNIIVGQQSGLWVLSADPNLPWNRLPEVADPEFGWKRVTPRPKSKFWDKILHPFTRSDSRQKSPQAKSGSSRNVDPMSSLPRSGTTESKSPAEDREIGLKRRPGLKVSQGDLKTVPEYSDISSSDTQSLQNIDLASPRSRLTSSSARSSRKLNLDPEPDLSSPNPQSSRRTSLLTYGAPLQNGNFDNEQSPSGLRSSLKSAAAPSKDGDGQKAVRFGPPSALTRLNPEQNAGMATDDRDRLRSSLPQVGALSEISSDSGDSRWRGAALAAFKRPEEREKVPYEPRVPKRRGRGRPNDHFLETLRSAPLNGRPNSGNIAGRSS